MSRSSIWTPSTDYNRWITRLKDVRPNHVGLDGVSIGERLDNLINMAAEDIKECANACDTYARKRLFTKVVKAFSWDVTLKEYIQRFSDRKAELNFAIAVHTGTRIDQANNKLDTLMGKYVLHPDCSTLT